MFSFSLNRIVCAASFKVQRWGFGKLSSNVVLVLALLSALSLEAFAQVQKFEGIGRTATPAEIKAWDIDVRPDFKGLPKGAGSVSLGEQVWDGKCASCHGTFGESNQVFFQLVGFTTQKDVEKGHSGALQLGHDAPARTMSMKLSTLSTLWDYINRAMPWNAPKSLTADEVYGVTAYLLNLSNVLPDHFVLSDKNMAQVQDKLPNRSGMTIRHAMWPGRELNGVDGLKAKPDTQGSACVKECKVSTSIVSQMPSYAMTAHGDLAEQNRTWGSVIGLDTSKPILENDTLKALPVVASQAAPSKASTDAPPKPVVKGALKTMDVMPVLQKNACTACHAVKTKVMGPAFKEVAKKYAERKDAAAYLASKIKSGGSGAWGTIPMPPMAVSEAEAAKIALWLSQGASD